jgi:CRISPR-associated protein Csm3
MLQEKSIKLTGKIVVMTGLHIGTSNDKIEIGGMDNPVIRNPLTREPYIPGSSIKGKMRSLLEWKKDKIDIETGKLCECGEAECDICRIFGSSGGEDNEGKTKKALSRGPTRLIIRDSELAEDYKKEFREGKPILEDKSENSINRITAEANPRHMERVVPGVKFNFELVYRIFDIEINGKKDEDFFVPIVIEGLRLLKNDYLGGGGTRGNGRIKYEDLDLTDEKGDKYDKFSEDVKGLMLK